MSTSESRPNAEPEVNAGQDWDAFDPEAYFQHYYAEPHPDDVRLTDLTARALATFEPIGRDLDILDVGTGASLIPLLCGLPRARTLTAWEYGAANAAWLRADVRSPMLRPAWQTIWNVARRAHASAVPGLNTRALPENPTALLTARTRVVEASLFDLPATSWDAATMFFCAESITQSPGEFSAALDRVCGAVRRGGLLIAAFLVQSDGYTVAGRRFPALRMTAGDIQHQMSSRLTEPQFDCIGIVSGEVRSGYSGAVFASGRVGGKP